jgi:glycerol kinase
MAWILSQIPAAKRLQSQGRLCLATIDSWLVYHLTGGQSYVTDMTNASRTMLFNIVNLQWDTSLLKMFKVKQHDLPQVLPSGSDFGSTKAHAILPDGIRIGSVMGDQQAALYGQGCYDDGQMKNTYGTGCFMLLNTGGTPVFSKKGLLTTIASDKQGQAVYALEGAVFIAGALIQWLRDGLKVIRSSQEVQERIKHVMHQEGLYVVPAFVGLAAPYWDQEARGIITGITRGTTQEHIIRASVEAIAYQVKDIIDLMRQERGARIKELVVDGGACRNDILMQFQADMLGIPIRRLAMLDSTVAGVAYLAGRKAGLYNDAIIARANKVNRIFKPTMSLLQRKALYQGWQKAIRQTLTK